MPGKTIPTPTGERAAGCEGRTLAALMRGCLDAPGAEARHGETRRAGKTAA